MLSLWQERPHKESNKWKRDKKEKVKEKNYGKKEDKDRAKVEEMNAVTHVREDGDVLFASKFNYAFLVATHQSMHPFV